MEKHVEVKGIRDGKAHCACGWESSFGGKYAEHSEQIRIKQLAKTLENEWLAKKLEELNEGLSWLGAQGNTPARNTAWGGVTACMDIIRRQIKELRGDAGVEAEPTTDERGRIRHLMTTEVKEYYEAQCRCGREITLRYNSGEMDSVDCHCGVVWTLESPIVEIWSQ